MKTALLILTLVLILSFMLCCQDKQAGAELEEFKAQAALEEQNKELAERYVETLNEGNYDALIELLSPDYAVYSPSGYPQSSSREKLIENNKMAREAFPIFTWNVEDMIAAKDKIICRMIARGIYKGGLPDIPAAEKEFEFSMITIMRMEDGKVVEEWQEDDQLGLARQLGMELKPKEEDK